MRINFTCECNKLVIILTSILLIMTIIHWPISERPREKLLQRGASVLSDAELLAIFLRTGIAGKSAVDLARELLQHFGSLSDIFSSSQSEFCQFPGLGNAKYAQLQAVLEMSRRALAEELKCNDVLNSPQSVRNFLRLSLARKPHEVFLGIFLDTRNQIIASEELASGTLTETSVYPREVIKRTLYHNAASVIFAHNHPSGKMDPSHADLMLTEILKKALATIDVKLLDHFIITSDNEILSFSEHHLI